MSSNIGAVILGLFLLAIGVSHFLVPRYYRRLVPAWVPYARGVILASGGTEIVLGALLLWPSARAIAAWSVAGLIGLYLLSHFDALAHSRGKSWKDPLFGPPGALLRIIVNLLYIGWAVWVATSV